jgi:hypothetical protein
MLGEEGESNFPYVEITGILLVVSAVGGAVGIRKLVK